MIKDKKMINGAIQSLEGYLVQFPLILKRLELSDLEYKQSKDKWSKKEILGHLIDSATNNLTRFITGQFQDNPTVLYDQVSWCTANYYQKADLGHMIALWECLNRQLLFICNQLTPEILSRKVNGNTLEFLINDYISHFEHHLRQITVKKFGIDEM